MALKRLGIKDGTYMPLHWEGEPEWFAVKGRLSPGKVLEAVAYGEGLDIEDLEFTGYLFARLEPAPADSPCEHILYLYDEPDVDKFPVALANLKESADGSKNKAANMSRETGILNLCTKRQSDEKDGHC